MKRRFLLPLMGMLGIGAAIFLVINFGYSAVFAAFKTAGWSLLLIIPLHLLTISIDSEGWGSLLRGQGRKVHRAYLIWAASVRDAIASLIPITAGGSITGIRLLILRKIQPSVSVASILAEDALMMASELILLLVGISLYVIFLPTPLLYLYFLLPVLFIAVLALTAIFWAQLNGKIFDKMAQGIRRFVDSDKYESLVQSPLVLKESLHEIYSKRGSIWRCVAWQLVSLSSSVLELWVILLLMHEPRSFLFVLLLQSVGRMLRSITFIVPASIGVQEAIYALLAPLGGLSPSFGIALSLATRFRDMVIGIPMIVSWQIVEARGAKLWRRIKST